LLDFSRILRVEEIRKLKTMSEREKTEGGKVI